MAAATYDVRRNTANGLLAKHVEEMGNGVSVVSAVFDASLVNVATGESVSVLDIPDNAFVVAVAAECLTAEGATATVDVGDDAGATQFLSNFNANSAAGKSVAAASTWKLYTAANDIRITADHDLDACKIQVWAVFVSLV